MICNGRIRQLVGVVMICYGRIRQLVRVGMICYGRMRQFGVGMICYCWMETVSKSRDDLLR